MPDPAKREFVLRGEKEPSPMGRPISISLPHDLGVTEARRRIDEGFGRLTAQLGGGGLAGGYLVEWHWAG